jgi:hypothetical protein
MTMRNAISAVLGLLLLAVLPVHAAEDLKTIPVDDSERDDKPAKRHESVTYSGIGLTQVSTDFDNLKSAVNLGITLGFRVPTFDIFGAEVEIGTTIIPGENKGSSGGSTGNCGGLLQPACPGDTASGDDLQMNNIAVYGVLRSPGKLYGMGKFGYRYINSSIAELQENKSGSAWGLGGGYRWGESLSGVELFYTKFSEHITYIGFSIAYGFDGRNRD